MQEKQIIDIKKEINKFWALMSYLWILCFLPLIFRKKNKFARFHAKQGLVLFLISFLIWIPIFGLLVLFVVMIFSIWGIFNVLGGKQIKLPLIGSWAERIKSFV